MVAGCGVMLPGAITGRAREVHWLMRVLAAAFVEYSGTSVRGPLRRVERVRVGRRPTLRL